MKKGICILLWTFGLAPAAFCQTDSTKAEEFGKFGWGMDLGPCTGMYFLTGDAKKNISEGWCYANAGMTFSYDRFHFTAQLGGMSGSIKNKLAHGAEWKAGNHFGSAHLQVSVGYELLAARHFNIIPFVSPGMSVFSTSRDTTGSYGVADTRWLPSYAVGAAFDLKLNMPIFRKNRQEDADYARAYYYLRLMTGVYPGYFRQQLGINGSMCFVNLSLGMYLSNRRAP